MNDANLGGRLPLLDPDTLQPEQKTLYQQIDQTLIPWATKGGFVGKTDAGRFIGPFNPFLYSPEIATGFLQFMKAESEHTKLTKRVQEIVILSVGSVWQAHYEMYAHSAMARAAGFSEPAIVALTTGEPSIELSPEEIVAQRFALQLTKEHKVDAGLYNEAEAAFRREGVVDLTFLIGLYLYTCASLNAFAIPAPTQGPTPQVK